MAAQDTWNASFLSLEAVAKPGPEFVILVPLSTTGLHVRWTKDGFAVRRVLRRRSARLECGISPDVVLMRLAQERVDADYR